MIALSRNNLWFTYFAKICTRAYELNTANKLIRECLDDIRSFGYEHVKEYWRKFMDSHSSTWEPDIVVKFNNSTFLRDKVEDKR